MRSTAALPERIEEARAACLEALRSDELAAAIQFLIENGLTVERGIELLHATAKAQRPMPELLAVRNAAISAVAPPLKTAAFERALLLNAALRIVDRVAGLPVDESVKKLFCKEFVAYACPPPASVERFAMTTFSFITMSRIVFLLRFPAGLLDWEPSGLPRSWLRKMPPRYLLRTLRFLTFEAKGLQPYFVWHMGGTVQQHPFLLEREGRKSFYRMVAAAERQPEVKALMAGSWLLSKETHRVSPHLEFLARPFLEAGGIYTEAGPAHIDDGFLAGDEKRRQLYEAGEYKPTFGVVICTRRQAIDWKQVNANLEPLLDVK